jgi:hypothetical protein
MQGADVVSLGTTSVTVLPPYANTYVPAASASVLHVVVWVPQSSVHASFCRVRSSQLVVLVTCRIVPVPGTAHVATTSREQLELRQ